jgi:hypothetical protein
MIRAAIEIDFRLGLDCNDADQLRMMLGAMAGRANALTHMVDRAEVRGLAAGRTAAAAEVVVHADANPDDTSAAYWKARDITEGIPGYAHSYGVSFDGDTLWLECDSCETPVHGIDAGDSLEVIVTKARDHERVCGAARVAENGADRGVE